MRPTFNKRFIDRPEKLDRKAHRQQKMFFRVNTGV